MSDFKEGIQYHIPPDSTVTLTGAEFVNILNTLNGVLQSPVYQEQLAIANTVARVGMIHELISGKLKDLVEAGSATEVAKEEGSNNIPLGAQPAEVHTMD